MTIGELIDALSKYPMAMELQVSPEPDDPGEEAYPEDICTLIYDKDFDIIGVI